MLYMIETFKESRRCSYGKHVWRPCSTGNQETAEATDGHSVD